MLQICPYLIYYSPSVSELFWNESDAESDQFGLYFSEIGYIFLRRCVGLKTGKYFWG